MNTPLSYLNVFYEAEYFIKYMFAFLKCEFVGKCVREPTLSTKDKWGILNYVKKEKECF